MIPPLLPIQQLARAASCAVRAALRRSAMVGAALLIATLGAAFLVLAAYTGLRTLLGPGLAALTMGMALLALAAGLMLFARNRARTIPPSAMAPPPSFEQAPPPPPEDTPTVAVFVAAFLLGRQLADRLADRRDRSGKT
jgi:hypothetical protein